MRRGVDRRNLLSAAGLSLLFGSRLAAAFEDAGNKAQVVTRRGYTDCRYGQLHYLRGAPADGGTDKPTLVLLHQNPSSSVEYEYLLQAMAEDREVIAFDTPGNGMSDWPPEPLDMAGYALAFADGIENLSLGVDRPVDIFGYHTGTFLGAELAIAEPKRVGRLVLSGIPYRTPEERQERLDKIAKGPKLTEDGAEILEMQRNLWAFVVTQRDPRVPLDRAARVYMEKAKPMDRYWWPYGGVWSYEVEKRFPLITQPVLVVQPHEDLLEYSRKAAELIPKARFVGLPELDRDVFDVGVAQFAEEMRRFLT
jgi:pimeloyl-ACP methyl ester carboxylesterase